MDRWRNLSALRDQPEDDAGTPAEESPAEEIPATEATVGDEPATESNVGDEPATESNGGDEPATDETATDVPEQATPAPEVEASAELDETPPAGAAETATTDAASVLDRWRALKESLADGDATSEHGLGGYHGSVAGHYYAVAVYSEGTNGIVVFDEPWKNVCATVYHELEEVRTDPDVEDAARTNKTTYLGWYSPRGGEIGDIPISESGGDLSNVFREVPLANGRGTVPIQLMWSNRDDGPSAG